ncbi:MAG: N-6 DNA methylase, partial [Methanimicrococcus sp.]|nr:N-6 DNA methylase [Methanimicrococcus sp.]
MITNKDAEEILKKEYHRDNFLYLTKDVLLPDFADEKHEVQFNNTIFESVMQLGTSQACDVEVFEVILKKGVQNRRVAITQEMFRILRGLRINNALVAFSNSDAKNYRFSLLTSKYEFDDEFDKIVRVISNPRRYSYSLGFGAKTRTAYDFLIKKGKVTTLDELVSRFSVEVVNKQFYSEIALCFTELVGGERDGKEYTKQLELRGVTDQNKYAEFAVRLIGRIVFCWFLREKKSVKGVSLMPDEIFSQTVIKKNANYYHAVLEPVFFEILNTKQNRRKDKFSKEKMYNQIPYLNGGLFSPHTDDFYKYSQSMKSESSGDVHIPDKWFDNFFDVLNQYNFTVDENTSYDVELSIDPEMLGRIFENLLAEINPQTGESAKKSTGSFYTPRDIVDYMVDSSLYEYLQEKTDIENDKLRAVISYGKEDDELSKLTPQEKKKIIDALDTLSVLDPACGSGAFPIGMLQKIVYILQEIDPEAKLWFNKATENMNVFLKKEFEKKFNEGAFDYIRKLMVIQNSIFGIDIQPIAVEIARLRCFLSLIIEEKVDDAETNRGVNPLPNLDFKFVIANTLVELENGPQTKFFEDREHIKDLKDVRDEYFNADSERRSELREEFGYIQKKMFQTILENNKHASSKYKSLSDWEPFKNVPTEWFDPEWMFGLNKFDLIIANPPYVHLEKMPPEEKKKFMHRERPDKKGKDIPIYETYSARGDLYCLFYERGIKLLKENGFLTFITSNKWMRAGYGESLRNYFVKNTNPIHLIDLGSGRFSSATVDTNIIMLQKAKNNHNLKAVTYNENGLENMSDYIRQNEVMVDYKLGEGWTILNPIEQSIKRKIETVGTPL